MLSWVLGMNLNGLLIFKMKHLVHINFIKSGSGKTTLLNVLNFRNKGELITDGEVRINGKLADWDKLTRVSGFCQQDPIFNGVLTVREHLLFAVTFT